MRSLRLFDLHCDTLFEALKHQKSIVNGDMQLSLERLSEYEHFCQVMAVWSDYRVSEDTAYKRFFEARKKLASELKIAKENGLDVRLCTSDSDLSKCEVDKAGALFLAVEGGKLIGSDLRRLDMLYKCGVRFLTLVWNKTCAIGGAHDTDEGLTDFGREVVLRCLELGIIPDVSHASAKMTDEVIDICSESGGVCIATHSNSYQICAHRRNLTDARFKAISKLGGVVGISLAPMHLTSSEVCTVDDIIAHIDHYLSIGGENTVCLGCDLDGVTDLPVDFQSVSDLYKIADKLAQFNYNDTLIDKIFYANARNFISLWLN
jgi:membrane dipeptidase